MVAYQQNELISSTELVKKFAQVMNLVKEKSVAKMGVLKNNSRIPLLLLTASSTGFQCRVTDIFLDLL